MSGSTSPSVAAMQTIETIAGKVGGAVAGGLSLA
jgi:hypothetical protein